ncbi:MAG: NAD(P)H-hydrate dehydratase [Microbacterium sp.]|uniref:ADP-dependent NAD(P)H-hydrate dehydratase n=1 Tax=Microbacterium sp. TaxID=51671 RepID=UPI003A852D6D
MSARIRVPGPADDKYRRGVVGLRTGSDAYPGAAVLGVEAAWRTGIGMVRYVGPDRAAQLVLQRRPETVWGDGRVQAWVIGSGTEAGTRPAEETAALRGILSGSVPVVVDAGALGLAPGAAAPLLATPHAREHDALRAALGLAPVAPDADDDTRADAVRATADALGGAVLLKGSVTIVAAPGGAAIRVGPATPWLATAGTGDVLAGVLGSLTAAAGAAAPDELVSVAALAARLHDRAARIAAGVYGPRGGPITALDVAAALPHAVAEQSA